MSEVMKSARHPAAFINNIADEGTKAEAIEWLQKTWDDYCDAVTKLDGPALDDRASAERCPYGVYAYKCKEYPECACGWHDKRAAEQRSASSATADHITNEWARSLLENDRLRVAHTRLRGLVAEREKGEQQIPYWLVLEWIDDLFRRPAPSAEPKPRCTDGECSKYRNMNGGCDVCHAPCL